MIINGPAEITALAFSCCHTEGGAFYYTMTREEKAQFCMDNKKESPAFQFYPKDWFGSRHVSAMNSSQRGIHAAFIFAAWLEPICGFPKGEEWLTARVPETEKTNCFLVLTWCWFSYCDFWFNERLLDERIKQIKLSLLRIDVGKRGGRPKKSKIYKSKPKGNQKDSKAKANETKSANEKEIEKEEENNNKRIVIKYLDWVYLTDKEYSRLKKELGLKFLDACIFKLNSYLANNEKKRRQYKDHNLVIRNWVIDEVLKKMRPSPEVEHEQDEEVTPPEERMSPEDAAAARQMVKDLGMKFLI